MKKRILLVTISLCFLLSLKSSYALDNILGPNNVLIPNAGKSIAWYTVIEGYTFEPFSLSGITLDKHGLLTITKTATPQTITILASNETGTFSKDITLHYSWSKQNPEFEQYQIKDTIEPISKNTILTNLTYHSILKYGLLLISICILLGYIKKRKEIE